MGSASGNCPGIRDWLDIWGLTDTSHMAELNFLTLKSLLLLNLTWQWHLPPPETRELSLAPQPIVAKLCNCRA